MLTAFFTRVSFVKVKTANFRLFCFKTDQVLFLLYPTVATRKLRPNKNSHETAEENVKQRELHAISIATSFVLSTKSPVQRLSPFRRDEELCNSEKI